MGQIANNKKDMLMLLRGCDFCGNVHANANTVGERIAYTGSNTNMLNVIIRFELVKYDSEQDQFQLDKLPDICNDCVKKYTLAFLAQHGNKTTSIEP